MSYAQIQSNPRLLRFSISHFGRCLRQPFPLSLSFSKMKHSDADITMAETNGVGLTEDLLIEIISRLPLKCIYQSKCVSRSWSRLISEIHAAGKLPLIISGVFYRNGDEDGGELKLEPRYGCNSSGTFLEPDLSFLPFYHSSSIIDCSNGLLLFYRSLPPAFHVCNPTTMKWAALPKPRSRSQLSILAFDAFHSPYYKVLCFSGWDAQGGRVEVFSSDTGRWAAHTLHWGLPTDRMSALMHYFSGVLHVLALPKHVVSIDLQTMSCTVRDLPERMNHDACLGNSGGFLHCVINDGEELRIWALKGSMWELKHRVSVSFIVEWGGGSRHLVSSCDELHHGEFNFLAFHPVEEVVYLWVLGKLVAYDLCKKTFGLVCELGTDKEKAQLIHIWLFPFSNYVSDCLA